MSASCEMTITVIGTDEEFNSILNKMHEIEGEKSFNFSPNPHYPFRVEGHTIFCDNGSCRNIWGWNYLEPEDDMFKELAKVAPNASFNIDSSRLYEGGGGGCETYLNVEYKNRRLTFNLQPYVDTMSFAELINNAEQEFDAEDIKVAVVGRLKFHKNASELGDYLETYDITLMPSVSRKADYVICNNPNSTAKSIEKAKILNIPIITEANAIRIFGDIYDFDDVDALIRDITYEDFCAMYDVDDTVTKEVFERIKESDYSNFIFYGSNQVSLEGPWYRSIYSLNENNEFQ